jgi:hypothetical protein
MASLVVDPVSGETFQAGDAYLASDGETYAEATLLAAMAADPWKRSPVTREVLRDVAFRNVFVDRVLGVLPTPDATPALTLYDRTAASVTSVSSCLPPRSRRVTWELSACLCARETLVRRKFGVPDAACTVTAIVLRDGAGNDWLMHPPCVAEMRQDVLDLAKTLGVHRMVLNPWCLTWATLGNGVTVEAQWIMSRLPSS